MSDILQNLTVGILTCDQSSTYNKTIDNLRIQKYQPKEVKTIRNIYPVSKAIKKLINDTTTEFIVILDDDMTFIYDDALNIFVSEITARNMDELIYFLNDPVFGKIKGIRIYRTEVIKTILNNLVIEKDWDVDINKQLQKKDKSITIDFIIGNHHEQWTTIDLYWKMFTIAKKLQNRDNDQKMIWIKRHINSLINIKGDNELILFGFAGLVDGLKDKSNETFLSYEKKFNNISYQDLFDSLKDKHE